MTGFYQSQQSKSLVSEYIESPTGNVITVIKSEEGSYPYHISYIAEIHGDTAVVFDWGYSYSSKSEAEKGVRIAYKMIIKNDLKNNFSLPHLMPLDIVKEMGIVNIRVLDKPVDWRKSIPPEFYLEAS